MKFDQYFFQTGWHHQLESLPPWVSLTIWKKSHMSCNFPLAARHITVHLPDSLRAMNVRTNSCVNPSVQIPDLSSWALGASFDSGPFSLDVSSWASCTCKKRMSRVCAWKKIEWKRIRVLGWCFYAWGQVWLDYHIYHLWQVGCSVSCVAPRKLERLSRTSKKLSESKILEFASPLLPSSWSFQV